MTDPEPEKTPPTLADPIPAELSADGLPVPQLPPRFVANPFRGDSLEKTPPPPPPEFDTLSTIIRRTAEAIAGREVRQIQELAKQHPAAAADLEAIAARLEQKSDLLKSTAAMMPDAAD